MFAFYAEYLPIYSVSPCHLNKSMLNYTSCKYFFLAISLISLDMATFLCHIEITNNQKNKERYVA